MTDQDQGDRGRRVVRRRRELGLSREELARQVGTGAGCLEYLEGDRVPRRTPRRGGASLWRSR